MALEVPCPNCGLRPTTEFVFGGEDRPNSSPDPEADFARVLLPANVAGRQRERWFHALGCRAWFTVWRDTTTNWFG